MEKRETSEKNFRVLALKYRPRRFSELVGQEALVKTLTNSFVANRIAHAFLLNGVRGVGKTSTARVIAKALNCLNKKLDEAEPCNTCENCKSIQFGRNVDVIEMDGASKTGVNDVREIIDTVYYRAASSKFKVYIIDEVHMLSNAAFNALLKTLEEPPEHVKFILATTEIQKIPPTVLSRVQRYDLKRINNLDMINHLEHILKLENISPERTALQLISREAEGSLRDALSLLDQVLLNSENTIKLETVNELIGKVSKVIVLELLDLILCGNTKESIKQARILFQGSVGPEGLLKELLGLVHFVSLIMISDEFLSDDTYTKDEQDKAKEIAKALTTIKISSLWQILFKGIEEIKIALDPLISFEMLMIKATHMSLLPKPESIIKNILHNKSDILNFVHKGSNNKDSSFNSKNEEIKTFENVILKKSENHAEQHKKNDEKAVKEILDIFPGSKIDSQE